MDTPAEQSAPMPSPAAASAGAPAPGLLRDLVRLARPKQWVKSGFVLVGPVYGMADLAARNKTTADWVSVAVAALGAVLAFGFAASAGYVINDLRDRELDRVHPRKSKRPIAAGRVSTSAARVYAGVLAALALGAIMLVPGGEGEDDPALLSRTLLGLCVLLYAVNTVLYTVWLKRATVIDVVSLAMGFVLRVLGGCAAVGIAPSAWLLSCTFFVSMFLALGKRLGERRTLGADAAAARGVQALYTDDFLRMSVVVTGVATLLSYSDYVVAQSKTYTVGFNLLWLTILPATYGLLRCIVLIERGVYDDPTELATRDRPFQAACIVFGLLTAALLVGVKLGWLTGV